MFTLAMGIIPDYEGALARMVEHIRAGGRVAIADGKRSTRWHPRSLNGIAQQRVLRNSISKVLFHPNNKTARRIRGFQRTWIGSARRWRYRYGGG